MFSRRIREPLPPVWDLRPPTSLQALNTHPQLSAIPASPTPSTRPWEPGLPTPEQQLAPALAMRTRSAEAGTRGRAVRPRTSNARIKLLTPLLQQGWVQIAKCLPLIWESNGGGPAVNH